MRKDWVRIHAGRKWLRHLSPNSTEAASLCYSLTPSACQCSTPSASKRKSHSKLPAHIRAKGSVRATGLSLDLQIRQVGFSPDRGVRHLVQVLFMHSRRMASAVCKVVKPIPDFFVLCRSEWVVVLLAALGDHIGAKRSDFRASIAQRPPPCQHPPGSGKRTSLCPWWRGHRSHCLWTPLPPYPSLPSRCPQSMEAWNQTWPNEMQEQAKVFQWSSHQEHLSQNGDILLKWTLQTYSCLPASFQANRKECEQCNQPVRCPNRVFNRSVWYSIYFTDKHWISYYGTTCQEKNSEVLGNSDHLQSLPTSKKDLLFICRAKNVQKHLQVQVLWIGQKATIEIRQSMATGPGRSNTSTEFKDSFLRKRYESLSRRWKQTLQFKINNVISCHLHYYIPWWFMIFNIWVSWAFRLVSNSTSWMKFLFWRVPLTRPPVRLKLV